MWRMVISSKKNRKGEAFILYGDKFVMKVYRFRNTEEFARKIVEMLNAQSATQPPKELS